MEGTSDSPIISWFGDVYILNRNKLFVNDTGMEMPQLFAPRLVIDSAATVCSDLKKYAEKSMFDVFYIAVA